ncbi:ATP-binding protein [Geomonas sp.]|uniref:ATP-binding protein n=1 Tax=Geomonas sp. TaxID=2651584 RepID=UPI002B494040|nr:ATP-binding protein [Geomonas sp.]HJV34564.1 ATP-binding protein [Geomonas sp.]
MGDELRLQQALGNLIVNALKFTKEGFVRVAAEGRPADGVLEVTLRVTDSGVGIAADYLPHLFGIFSQADAGTARKYGGSGLGLALTKQIVEALGGSIGVESEEGKGSTFHFTIPLRIA